MSILGPYRHSLCDSGNPLLSWQCSMGHCFMYWQIPAETVPKHIHRAPAWPTPPESSGLRCLCPRATLLLMPQATSRFLVVVPQNWLALGLPTSHPGGCSCDPLMSQVFPNIALNTSQQATSKLQTAWVVYLLLGGKIFFLTWIWVIHKIKKLITKFKTSLCYLGPSS